MKLKNYQPSSPKLWQGRIDHATDVNSFRLHQVIQRLDLNSLPGSTTADSSKKFVLLGFVSDEGVRRNHGRVGAKEGPLAIRKALMNLPVHFDSKTQIYDAGDVLCADGNLEASQQALSVVVQLLLSRGFFPIILGGGHEVAFGHGLGLYEALQNQKHSGKNLGILNFDAHFDLRPVERNQSTSGTPFLQLADHCAKSNIPFHYYCVGIQKAANTKALFHTANRLGVEFIEREEFFSKPQTEVIQKLKSFLHSVDKVYLTLCLDVFAQSYAPGVSAPNAMGLVPSEFFPLLSTVLQSGKVLSFDCAEMAPLYDQDQQTAKFAARIVWEVLHQV